MTRSLSATDIARTCPHGVLRKATALALALVLGVHQGSTRGSEARCAHAPGERQQLRSVVAPRRWLAGVVACSVAHRPSARHARDGLHTGDVDLRRPEAARLDRWAALVHEAPTADARRGHRLREGVVLGHAHHRRRHGSPSPSASLLSRRSTTRGPRAVLGRRFRCRVSADGDRTDSHRPRSTPGTTPRTPGLDGLYPRTTGSSGSSSSTRPGRRRRS